MPLFQQLRRVLSLLQSRSGPVTDAVTNENGGTTENDQEPASIHSYDVQHTEQQQQQQRAGATEEGTYHPYQQVHNCFVTAEEGATSRTHDHIQGAEQHLQRAGDRIHDVVGQSAGQLATGLAQKSSERFNQTKNYVSEVEKGIQQARERALAMEEGATHIAQDHIHGAEQRLQQAGDRIRDLVGLRVDHLTNDLVYKANEGFSYTNNYVREVEGGIQQARERALPMEKGVTQDLLHGVEQRVRQAGDRIHDVVRQSRDHLVEDLEQKTSKGFNQTKGCGPGAEKAIQQARCRAPAQEKSVINLAKDRFRLADENLNEVKDRINNVQTESLVHQMANEHLQEAVRGIHQAKNRTQELPGFHPVENHIRGAEERISHLTEYRTQIGKEDLRRTKDYVHGLGERLYQTEESFHASQEGIHIVQKHIQNDGEGLQQKINHMHGVEEGFHQISTSQAHAVEDGIHLAREHIHEVRSLHVVSERLREAQESSNRIKDQAAVVKEGFQHVKERGHVIDRSLELVKEPDKMAGTGIGLVKQRFHLDERHVHRSLVSRGLAALRAALTFLSRWRRTTEKNIGTGGVLYAGDSKPEGGVYSRTRDARTLQGTADNSLVIPGDAFEISIVGFFIPPRRLRSPTRSFRLLYCMSTSTDGEEYVNTDANVDAVGDEETVDFDTATDSTYEISSNSSVDRSPLCRIFYDDAVHGRSARATPPFTAVPASRALYARVDCAARHREFTLRLHAMELGSVGELYSRMMEDISTRHSAAAVDTAAAEEKDRESWATNPIDLKDKSGVLKRIPSGFLPSVATAVEARNAMRSARRGDAVPPHLVAAMSVSFFVAPQNGGHNDPANNGLHDTSRDDDNIDEPIPLRVSLVGIFFSSLHFFIYNHDQKRCLTPVNLRVHAYEHDTKRKINDSGK